jgi:hypothetical protein
MSSGRAGKGASATSGSRGISAGSKKSVDFARLDSMARAARLHSRAGSSAKGDGLSEAAAAQSSKPKQPQAGTATEVSPTIRPSGQARGGKRTRAVSSSGSDDEDELAVSGAATTSEEQGRGKLRKCARIPVQKFKIHSSNIIIVKQPRRIHHSEINSNVARFAGWNIVAVHAPAPAPNFEGSN